MPHHTSLIATVAAAFVLALAFGFVAARLRAPPLVGYLIAGVALGPDGFQARRVLEIARSLHPPIRTAVRTHSDRNAACFRTQASGLVVSGERELALAIADYALACFGLPPGPRATSEPPAAARSSQLPIE
jgi:hypothetical protein